MSLLKKKKISSPPPTVSITGDVEWKDRWEAGFSAVYSTLLKNLKMPNSFFKTRYAFPSPIFRGAYLWDSAFISQVWKPWDIECANDVNSAVLDHAYNGRLQHFAGRFAKSGYTQPPVMAWSVWENYQWSGDETYLAYAYPILVDYNRWLYEKRRLECGLFFWKHAYESGIDNSPRFGSADEAEVTDVQSLAAVDLSSYMVRQNETLGKMAEVLGKKSDAGKFNGQAKELRSRINDLLWDDETGYYHDRDMSGNKLVRLRTVASLFPLFAGIPEKDRAERMKEHIVNPEEFNTFLPVPSVARNEPVFEKDCWRGPVWINTAYMVVVGLERYGFLDEASELAFKIVDGVFRNHQQTGNLFEFYDPDEVGIHKLHRKRGNLYKRLTLGDKPRPNFAGWTGLVNTLLIEHLAGFHKIPGKRSVAPNFPPIAKGAVIKLTLPAERIQLELTIPPDNKTHGKVISENKEIEFSGNCEIL